MTPIMASTLIPDTTPPRIVNATLNLTTGNLHLTFSEVSPPQAIAYRNASIQMSSIQNSFPLWLPCTTCPILSWMAWSEHS